MWVLRLHQLRTAGLGLSATCKFQHLSIRCDDCCPRGGVGGRAVGRRGEARVVVGGIVWLKRDF